MAQIEKRRSLLTPMFRVAFPQVDEPKVFQQGQKPRWSCVALFTPSGFNDDEKAKWAAVLNKCKAVAKETFKKEWKDLDRSVYKLPFHKGEEKSEYAGFGAGVIYFTMSAYSRKPGLVDARMQPIMPADLYPGCYARASVNPFANQQWKSVAIGMNHIQKLRDGERLDGATSAEEDFGSDPVEFESSGDDDLGIDGDGDGEGEGDDFTT